MSEHKVVVCCGTSCFLTGGDRINALKTLIQSKFGDKVECRASGCLGQCLKHYQNSEYIPPFAKIDGEILPSATNEKIIKALNDLAL